MLVLQWALGQLPRAANGWGTGAVVSELGEIHRLHTETEYHKLMQLTFKAAAQELNHNCGVSYAAAYGILRDYGTPLVRAQIYKSTGDCSRAR